MTAIDIPSTLAECERVIERGLKTFIDVGVALVTVRDGKLYRASYPTFEAYCQNRWSISRTRAYELISASEVTRQLSAIADTPQPANEGQARALGGLEPQQAAEVMTKAADTGKVTAATIKTARDKVAPKPEPIKVTETHRSEIKTETAIDPQTGEVLTEKPAPSAAEFLAADPTVQRSEFLMRLHQSLNKAMHPLRFQPDELGPVIDNEDMAAIDHAIEALTHWRDAVAAARPRHLRSVL